MGIKHTKVSNVADSANTNLVRPSDWNDDHTIDGDVDFGGHNIVNADLEFTDLIDAPSSLAGSGNKLVAVNAGATALEFIEPSAGGPVDEFTDLTDVPGSYSGQAGKVPTVNSGETALEFAESGGVVGWVTPQDHGLTDANQNTTITQSDIDANPQWIGVYPVGVYWDTVATQEAIYDAYAGYNSTPGSVVWNITFNNTKRNKTFYCPAKPLSYLINYPLIMVAQNFDFRFQARGGSAQWTYSSNLWSTGDTHTSTTIDNLDPDFVAMLVDFPSTAAIMGEGIIPGTFVTGTPSATSITISDAATSTVSGAGFYVWFTAFKCDSAAYGTFRNVTISAATSLQRFNTFDNSGNHIDNVSETCLWSLDGSGAFGGLKTQQLTLYDCMVSGAGRTGVGLAISPSGGGAQGDTITIINPYISGCEKAGLQISGGNALSIQVVNGDFQSCGHYGIWVIVGSVYVDGTSFQSWPFGTNVAFAPATTNDSYFGADVYLGSGAGATSTGQVENVRSEGAVGVVSTNQGGAQNVAISNARQQWFPDYPFQLGTVNSSRFMVVDTGGTNEWRHVVPVGSGDTITDLGSPGWTVNQWVGLSLFVRFGSNGFVSHFTASITANTANTVTVAGENFELSETSLYMIGGQTGSVFPTAGFDAAVGTGHVAYPGGVGFDLVAGSTTVTCHPGIYNNIAIGEYIAVPSGNRLGAGPEIDPSGFATRLPPRDWPFIAKVLNKTLGNTLTVDRAPFYTLAQVGAYYGPGFTDNDIIWLDITSSATFRGVARLERCIGTFRACPHVDTVYGIPYGDTSPNQDESMSVLSGQIVSQITTALDASDATLDVSDAIAKGNYSVLTPTQNIDLSADAPYATLVQEWTLMVKTSGTTSYNVTFGTNFKSTGVLATGTVTAKTFIMRFVSDGTSWCEASRTVAL